MAWCTNLNATLNHIYDVVKHNKHTLIIKNYIRI